MYRLGLHAGILLSFNLKRIFTMATLLLMVGIAAYVGTAKKVANPPPRPPYLGALAAEKEPYARPLAAAFDHLEWIEHRYPPADKFWEKYLPIAQLGCALSIAYLALPYFRHLKTLGERAAPIVGRTTDELAEFRRIYDGEDPAKIVQGYGAGERRHELVGLLTISHPLVAVSQVSGDELRTAIRKLRGNECFMNDHSRLKFLDTYLTGGDIATVTGGLTLGVSIHVLAFVENIVVWQTQQPLGGGLAQSAIFILLLFWTCGAPIYFAYYGEKVSFSLDSWLHAANIQRRDFDAITKRDTGGALDNALTSS